MALSLAYLFIVMASSYNPKNILIKILSFLISLLMLGSGMLLLNRFGISLTGPYPIWVWAKLLTWLLLLTIPFFIIKKFPQFASRLNALYLVFAITSVYLGVFKP